MLKMRLENPKKLVPILTLVATIINRGWCRGSLAKNAGGEFVSYDAIQARRWCLQGAILRAQFELKVSSDDMLTVSKLLCAVGEIRTGRLSDFNDTSSKTEVLKLVQRARTYCEGHREGALLH